MQLSQVPKHYKECLEVHGSQQVQKKIIFIQKNFSGKKIREEFRLEDKTIILFMGTPKKQKGVDELIQAVEELRTRDESLHLLIVGAEKDNSYVQTLKEKQGLTIVGYRDNKEMPDFLAAADR